MMNLATFLCYNIIALINLLVLYGMFNALVGLVCEHFFKNLTAALATVIDRYYKAKEEYIMALSKLDDEFLDKVNQKSKRSSFN